MKRTLLFVLALISVGCGEESAPRDLDELFRQERTQHLDPETKSLRVRGPVYLDPFSLEPYSGPVLVFHPDDTATKRLWRRGTLKRGYWHGPIAETDLNGVVYSGEAYMGDACGEWINPSTGERGFRSRPEAHARLSVNVRTTSCPNWEERADDWIREFQGSFLRHRNYTTRNDPFLENTYEGVYPHYKRPRLGDDFVIVPDFPVPPDPQRSAAQLNRVLGSELYGEDGRLLEKGTYNWDEKCDEWIEGGDSVTYPPCPPPPEGVELNPPGGLVEISIEPPEDWD